jgi:protease-4
MNLVDELGDLQDAIRFAADLAGIEGEPRVVEPRKRFSIRDLIESRVLGTTLPRLEFQTGVSLKYLMAF